MVTSLNAMPKSYLGPMTMGTWPYGQSERKPSKEAWWRILGRGRKRDMEDDE